MSYQGTTTLDSKYLLPGVQLDLLTSTCIQRSWSSKNTSLLVYNEMSIGLKHKILQ